MLAVAGLGVLLILGAVQGATEFLPISSSGHLVLFGNWLDPGADDGLVLEVALHFGTLVAVLIFCFRDVLAMLRPGSAGLWRLMLLSTLITAALGLALEDLLDAYSTPGVAGIGLLVTATLLFTLGQRDDERLTRHVADGTHADAVLLGLLQSLALVPGISRSGATLSAALLLGFARRDAVRIAFLMSVPVVFGAVILKASDGGTGAFTEPGILGGMAMAAIVGLAALKFISVHVDARSLRRFGIYCAVLGLAAILTGLFGD